jgi:hypothetical protein
MSRSALVRRFERLLRDCRAEGVMVVADVSGTGAVRFIERAEAASLEADLRALGESVDVDGGCGSAAPRGVIGA